jgi:hypothetical protein
VITVIGPVVKDDVSLTCLMTMIMTGIWQSNGKLWYLPTMRETDMFALDFVVHSTATKKLLLELILPFESRI